MAGTLLIPTIGQLNAAEDVKIHDALNALNGLLTSSNQLDGAQVGAGTIPNTALTDGSITNAKLAGSISGANLASGAALANLAAGSVTDAKLSSPNNSAYKTLMGVSMGTGTVSGAGNLGTGTYYFTGGAGTTNTRLIATGTATTSDGPILIYFDDADYTVGGSLTQKLRIRQQVSVGATSPSTVTLNCGLYPVTIAAGNWTLGPVVSNSATTTSGLATNTISSFASASGDFTIPADGAYCLGVVIASVTCPAGIHISAQLQTRNV